MRAVPPELLDGSNASSTSAASPTTRRRSTTPGPTTR
jgi:hypothetical protein